MLEIIFLQASGNNYSQFIMLGGMVAISISFLFVHNKKSKKTLKSLLKQ
tara:strand:+ start:2037 stop:2183 length:147 start_codon:yes stop_codon:yes gene_type:complete